MEENKMELENKTLKELKEIAKNYNIPLSVSKEGKKGVRHNLTKEELIEAINEVHNQVNEPMSDEGDVEVTNIDESTSLNELFAARAEIDRLISIRKSHRAKKDPRNEEYDENFSMYGGVNPYTFIHTRNKERYIEEAKEGTLIAFLDENGKPRTAALVNRSSKRRVLKLKTEFDWEFIVPYDNVLWVRNSTRWAYGVYRILKGYNPNGKCGKDEFRESFNEQ